MSKSGLFDILDTRSPSKKASGSSNKTPKSTEQALPKSEQSVKFHQTRRGKNSFARLVGLL